MSGSEGKQNNEMSAKDIEAEEMAQELMNMEMYEVGMGYDQMKELLQFIDDSKNMAGIEPETRSSQESKHYSQEMAATEAVAKNSSMHDSIVDERPKPSFSYRQASGRASPIISGRKSALAILPVEDMPVSSPEMFESEDPARSGSENESILDKLVKENNSADKTDTVDIRAQTSTKNVWHNVSAESSQNSQSVETNVNEILKSRKNQRVERWKLDPTNAVVEENDVPLKQKNRPVLKERIPYRFCHNERIFQEANLGEKVLQVLSNTLEEVADIWRRKHRPDTSEFQWGSPIKVGADNRNTDKEIEEGDNSSPPRREILRRNPDSGQRRNMERNCKRKAAECIRNVVENQNDSGEDSDAIFDTVKKHKKSDEPWLPLRKSNANVNAEKNLTRQEKIFNNIKNSNESQSSSLIDEYDSDEFDNDDLHSLRVKNNKKKEDNTTRRSNTPEIQFPRRIVPPNPSKPKPRSKKNGVKAKPKSPAKAKIQTVIGKNKDIVVNVAKGKTRNPFAKLENKRAVATLNDHEISKELLNNEDTEDDDTDVEIKPMALKGLAGKVQLGKSRLLDSKRAEKRLEEAKIQEEREKEASEKKRRQQVQMARFLKESEERREKEAREQEIKAKEEAAKKAESMRDRERRRRQAEEKKRSLEAQKGRLLMDDEDGDSIIAGIDAEQRAMQERVQCPICLLEFSAGEIQAHAADCNRFEDDVNSPGTSRSPADNDDVSITNDDMIYDCNICSHYSTSNGIKYEQHVNNCMKLQRNSVGTQDRVGSQGTVILEAPTSPIRCFIPISEQTDSSINYADQFAQQKSKPNRFRNKRRR